MRKKNTPPAVTGEALNKDSSRNPYRAFPYKNQAIPSRAVLARRWPSLKINRLTMRWVDDATGARGDGVESLRAFLGRARAE